MLNLTSQLDQLLIDSKLAVRAKIGITLRDTPETRKLIVWCYKICCEEWGKGRVDELMKRKDISGRWKVLRGLLPERYMEGAAEVLLASLEESQNGMVAV